MASNVINLRRARKRREREDAKAEADANARRHGESRADTDLRGQVESLAKRRLDAHRLDRRGAEDDRDSDG